MIGKYYVVGYHLPISPRNYEIEFVENEENILMVSHFDISSSCKDCIPFCCLFPKCSQRKEVIDTFHLQNGNELVLQSSTAFGGCITYFEKGKIFRLLHVPGNMGSYLVLINEKEIFVLFDLPKSPTDKERIAISSAIAEISLSIGILPIRYET